MVDIPQEILGTRRTWPARLVLPIGLAIGIGVLVAYQLVGIIAGPFGQWAGVDYVWYIEAARRFLATGSPYAPYQLAGPYPLTDHPFIHPPTSLVLFVPFVFLPSFLWWAAPAAIFGVALWRLRPGPWTWPVMLVLMLWPRSLPMLLVGNTDMWVTALVAAGAAFGWPAATVIFLKPSLGPLGLVGIRRRSWWITVAIGVAISIAMLPLWLDYRTVIANAPIDLAYSLLNLPMPLIGLVAYVGRTRRDVSGRVARGASPTPDTLVGRLTGTRRSHRPPALRR